jgi:hypothetical protein
MSGRWFAATGSGPNTRTGRGGRGRAGGTAGPAARLGQPRFLLDVHLGALCRRLRLLGLDVAYHRDDVGDDALIAEAARAGRVLLTRDRGPRTAAAARSAAWGLRAR